MSYGHVARGPGRPPITLYVAGRPIVASTRKVTYEEIEGTDGLLSTVFNVEVCAVGIEYPLASGKTTFTPDDLLEAVASQEDPAIHSPRVWLGHVDDDRFHKGRSTQAGSAEPAIGTVINLRVEDDGMTLVGDIAGCPTWFAKIMASAFPNRSIEGFQNAETVTGGKWGLVITDLALLGVRWPGVQNLEDLQALYSEEGPVGVEVEEETPMSAVAAAATNSQVQAQAELEKVRRAFIAALQGGELKIPGYPWVRAILQDPNELIVDDDEGGLYAVTYDASGDKVTFGEPVEKKIQYVNAEQKRDPDARTLLANMLTDGRTVAASWDKRSESRPESSKQEVTGMPPELIKRLRAKLGLSEEQLPDDATEEQVTAVLAEGSPSAPAEGDVTPPAGPGPAKPDPEPGATPEQVPSTTDPNNPEPVKPPEAGQPTEEQVAAAQATLAAAGHVSAPKDIWAQVQANAKAGAEVAASTEKTRRDGIVVQAAKDGRIAPAQKTHFRQMFETDPQGTEKLLTAAVDQGGLMPGTIPVEARGIDPSPNDMSVEAYPAEWLPELQPSGASPITMEV